MPTHVYRCGQYVTFVDKRLLDPSWSGDFLIVRHLPSGDEEPRYEVKNACEVYSRVAYEYQLATSFTIFR